MSPHGQTIVSGGYDSTVRLSQADWRAWLQVCCHRLRYHPTLLAAADRQP
ncbi:MAG: hypothetical protein HWQ35_16735 [Nostoc sp. NMS1]|nr:hypothetical protein [Nostoc sp. NMS1]MBN3908127.1 hypothetical protein [Nostoc sp. NMS1]